jgi:formylglycine-generating enzyme required for sulfatase activity
VVLPAGEFMMGSPPGEMGRSDNEGPQHRVTIDYQLAIGRYPVMFAEYDHFCEMTGQRKPVDERHRGNRRRAQVC